MTERRKKWWTPFGLALLCAHCTVGAVATAAAAAGLATLPTVAGVPLMWVLPPSVLFGAFGLWLWSGRARGDKEACDLPAGRHE